MITIWHTCKRCKVVTAIDEDEYDDMKYHRDELCENCRKLLKQLNAELEEENNKRRERVYEIKPS